MSYSIITISRQFGSGGRGIGKALADALSIPYYDKDIVKLVAEKTGFHPDFVTERGEHAPFKTGLGYGFLGRNAHGISNDDLLWQAQCRVIDELAQKGPCVIVGRCADYLLRDRKDALHVFVHASDAFRCQHIVEHYGETHEKPQRRLDEKDKKRRISYSYHTGREWGHPSNYHMTLDTSKLGVDTCIDLILRAYKGE